MVLPFESWPILVSVWFMGGTHQATALANHNHVRTSFHVISRLWLQHTTGSLFPITYHESLVFFTRHERMHEIVSSWSHNRTPYVLMRVLAPPSHSLSFSPPRSMNSPEDRMQRPQTESQQSPTESVGPLRRPGRDRDNRGHEKDRERQQGIRNRGSRV